MKKLLLPFLLVSLTIQAQHTPDADVILARAIHSRKGNDPQRRLSGFSFNSYTKLIVSADPDSIPGQLDTVTRHPLFRKAYRKIDSTQYKLKAFVRRQHFFEMEKASHFDFDGRDLKETVTGTRMSGFSEPIYEVLGLNLQSLSLYGDRYELLETQYKSPLSRGAARQYRFYFIDSTTLQNRNVYRIGFSDRRKHKKAGLGGVLWIDAKTFGLARADFEVKGMVRANATHLFDFLPDEKLWVPTGRRFRLTKGSRDEPLRLPGNTIRFDAAANDDDFSTVTQPQHGRAKQASDFTYVSSESDFRDFSYGKLVKIARRAVAIEVTDNAVSRDDSFWKTWRRDSLDIREDATYRALDSIAAREKIEKKLRLGRKIINGYVPFGPIDLDLRYLLSFNNYEGFRLGLGGITNDKFSDKYRIDGYSVYGTKDGNFKYHLGGAARIGKFSATWIGTDYTDDVREIASTSFAIDKRIFKLYDPRPINVSTFYNYKAQRAYIETKIIPKTESIWQITQSRIEPKFDYVFTVDGKPYTLFHMTTAQVALQWNPLSDYMQTPAGRIETDKRYPRFTFQFTQSLPKVLVNDFAFGKIDFRAEYEKKFLDGQKTSALLEAGYAYGDTPLTHLYNTSPNNLNRDQILERITLAGKNSFETMYFNEFFSSQYAMLQLKHAFRRTKIFTRQIRPVPVLVTRMAWGNMEHPEQHSGISYKTLDKGFFESGVELNQIYKIIGLSAFYRYGPNGLPRFEDNISIKLSLILNLGF
jgi:hypothetical protein